jgi:hypothetical protein
MTPIRNERGVKARVKTILNSYGPRVWYYMPVPGGYGRSGVPDFVGCANKRFFSIETKFGGNQPTLHQSQELAAIKVAGGLAFVIDETNVEGLSIAMDLILRET